MTLTSAQTGFTKLQALDDQIIVDLRYATPNNFTKQVVYDFTTGIARTGTAEKLAHASHLLQTQGYRIKVWDAYRPVSAQEKLFEVYPDPTFVLPPNPNMSHQKGVTFDVTLTDLAGQEVEIPTAFDDFSQQAKRSSFETWTPVAQKHYLILDKAMQKAGFVGYENEWWDYRDSQMDDYQPLTADPNKF